MDTIRSVQSQTHTEIEHIFVDGGSTDGTLELIATHCPSAIVLHDVKGGISKAMNAGINAATGELVAHLHSDDYYAGPQVLATVVASISAQASEWAYGKISVLRDGLLTPADYQMRPFTLKRYAAGGATIPHPAVFVRKRAFDKIGGFDEGLKYAMDIDLWFRLGARFTPTQIDQVLAVFREHEGSLSTVNIIKARQEEWTVRLRYARQVPLATARFAIRHWRRLKRIRKEMAA